MTGDRDGGEGGRETKKMMKKRGCVRPDSSATGSSSKRSKVVSQVTVIHDDGDEPINKNIVVKSNSAFNICRSDSEDERSAAAAVLPLEPRSDESQNKRASIGHKVLRPGMVLLRNYVTLQDQVDIVKICQNLGVGPGGFYQPAFRFGTKLHLQMMCLGLNWDPRRYRYDAVRAFDGSRAPPIPPSFRALVQKALEDSHDLLINKECVNLTKEAAEDVLPPITPNACIVNFYPTATGKLGLHQDKSESKESLGKGLSVFSVSVGDTAEFLYGDERKVSKAQKVLLRSGDVLIFGGKSRHVFHAVSSIIPNTAPRELLQQTKLRPGRLNLTFREA